MLSYPTMEVPKKYLSDDDPEIKLPPVRAASESRRIMRKATTVSDISRETPPPRSTQAIKTCRIFSPSKILPFLWPNLRMPSLWSHLSNRYCTCIVFILFVGTTTFPLSPGFAQTSSLLGSSCQNESIKVFPITKWSQEDTPWCWAVTSAIVMAHHNKDLRPCEIVGLKLINSQGEHVDCCDAAGANYGKCLIRNSIGAALKDNSFKYRYEAISDPPTNLSYRNVSEQLCSNGPFISTITASNIRHAIVVYGYFIDDDANDPSEQLQVFVHDSQEEWPLSVNYDFFLEAGALKHAARHFSFCNNAGNNCPSD